MIWYAWIIPCISQSCSCIIYYAYVPCHILLWFQLYRLPQHHRGLTRYQTHGEDPASGFAQDLWEAVGTCITRNYWDIPAGQLTRGCIFHHLWIIDNVHFADKKGICSLVVEHGIASAQVWTGLAITNGDFLVVHNECSGIWRISGSC